MITIYCIEDINDLKYVGSTKQKLEQRLSQHKSDETRKRSCSSSKLNLYNCVIYSLETCNEFKRKEREQFWINRIECVNTYNTTHDSKKYKKEHYQKHRELNIKISIANNKKRKEQIKKYQCDYDLFRRKFVVNGCYEFIKMLSEY